MSFTIAFTKPSVVYTSLMTAGLRPALIAVAAVIGPMQAILVLPNSFNASSPNNWIVLVTVEELVNVM